MRSWRCGPSPPVDILSIALRKGLKHAIISENNGEFGVRVVNEIGDKAIIANNEPRK